jgi:hypothetical protein
MISPAPLLLLSLGERRAPIAFLSPAKRNALIACFNAGGLHKKAELGMERQAANQYPVLRPPISRAMAC